MRYKTKYETFYALNWCNRAIVDDFSIIIDIDLIFFPRQTPSGFASPYAIYNVKEKHIKEHCIEGIYDFIDIPNVVLCESYQDQYNYFYTESKTST